MLSSRMKMREREKENEKKKKNGVAHMGVEPTTSALSARRSNQLS